ncbi:acetyl-CoA carboxylase biotin carboxyl carrier protein subunit [Enterococcus florum]|uniref:Acetyl-CoA carboxylase biotin carboxyl carrier protein subunit n=1 Tax=Enterococcus florum TaxID=2480627 RepID=A0A4P5PGN0_9ENTE|nr:DUF2118 domain-containing protein [Enterococcus florum]GCF92633.1 acetyl-CoA carboxylase biotin carboxyl carrier protein subunit [Enterococcus florum]
MKNYEVTVDGQLYQVILKELTEEAAQNITKKSAVEKTNRMTHMTESAENMPIPAPMAGTILSICVRVGDSVKKGDTLCILEAMKMETPVVSPKDSTIFSINVSENQNVESNQLLMMM